MHAQDGVSCHPPTQNGLSSTNPPRAHRSVWMVSANPGLVQHMVGRTHRARMDFKAKTKGVFARNPPGEGGDEWSWG